MVAVGLNGFHADLNELTFRFRNRLKAGGAAGPYALKNSHGVIRTGAIRTAPDETRVRIAGNAAASGV
jgi:hypothetical protein